MSGNSTTHQPIHVMPLEMLSIPFNIDGETHEIDCVVTKHGHPLINASQYAVSFTGCATKHATNKLEVVANRSSELQNCKRLLCEHDKVSNHISVDFMNKKLICFFAGAT